MKNKLLLLRLFCFTWLWIICSTTVRAQSQQISGTVKDETGSSVEGADIIIKGSTKGVRSMANGAFTISISGASATLIISHVGFTTQELPVAVGSTQEIILKRNASALNDVVVIGYGTQRRREVTGAVAVVDLAATKDVPVANPTRLLVGQAPGVTVKQATGRPGGEFEINVRGLGSLGAGSAPLYVVDGFPVGTGLGQNFNGSDIENITILKDAVSTAIYGARGSNGVVLITTKNGKSGAPVLNVSSTYGIQNIPSGRKVKMLNGQEFAQFKKDIFMDKIRYFENREPDITEVPLDYRYPEQVKTSTNWFDATLHDNAPFSNYYVSLSQGNNNVHSFLSAGYTSQKGILLNTKFDNFSVRGNIDGKVNDNISMGLRVNADLATNNLAQATEGRDNIVGASLIADPRDPIRNPDGSYFAYIGGHDGVFGFANPVMSLTDIQSRSNIGQMVANAFIEVSFLKHFKFKSSVNGLLNYNSYKQFVPSYIPGENAPPPRDASETDQQINTRNYSTDQLLTYNNTFGGHRINVLAGYTAQDEKTTTLNAGGTQFPNDLTPFLTSAALKTNGSGEYGWSLDAFFGRVNYVFAEKYLFSGSFRREGSSRFGENVKYGNFPAVSAGWRISNEKFMSGISWLSDLKLRGSWGITGNNGIPNYGSLAFMSNNNYVLDNNLVRGQVVSNLPNPTLKWERSKQVDLGVDLAAFQDKLTFTAEYYDKITNDMLLSIPLPAISGFTSYLANIGKVQNKGFEFAARYKTKVQSVGLWVSGNVSINRNKVLAINGPSDQLLAGDFYGGYNISRPGSPIGAIFGFKMLGVFKNQADIDKSPLQDGAIPGVYKYYDANHNDTISYDTKDMVQIGNPWPKFTYGLSVGGDYKHFDFSVLINGAQGYDIYRVIEASTMNMDGVFNVLEESKQRYRNEQNPGNGRLATTNTWKWERESNSRYIYSGSHMWIKNISIGYTFNPATPKLMFKSLRLFASGDNMFLFTKYPGSNPDVNNRGGINPGLDDEAYPLARTFTFGANFTF